MDSPGSILFGAAFTGLTSLSLGLVLVQALRLPLHRTEARLLGFVLGAACLSLAVFLSTACWMAHPWWFGALGGAAIVVCLWRGAWRYGDTGVRERLTIPWRILVTVCMLAFGIFTLMHAMAPEISPDGSSYHLGTVSRYLRQGGFGRYTTNMYANLPAGVEMLFLFAFAFGKHSAAALVHWQFYFALPLLLMSAGKRFGYTKAGAVAALLVFCSPVAGKDGASAYVDVATGTVAFALFYLLVVWEQQRARGLLAAIGILAGFAYACKMTLWPAAPFAVAYVAFVSWRKGESWFRAAAVVSVFAALLILPWPIKNAIVVGNPVSPFLNRWFPNPHVRISFEEEYRAAFKTYHGAIKSPLEIPLEVTSRGMTLNGLLGPVFLLAPIGLFALRWPLGRRVLLAAAVFLVSYPNNIGTRFLLTPLPFIAFAMGMVLSGWRGMAATVVLFHAFTSWPAVLTLIAAPHSWRLYDYRFKAAFRIEKPEGFMDRWLPEYRLAQLIEQKVPPDGKVFTFSGVPEAYTSRDIIVAYAAGWNNMLGDTLMTGVAVDAQPVRAQDFQFACRPVRRLRVVQTKTSPHFWNITELRLFEGGKEIVRGPEWRLRSNPNIWDVQLAFDNNPATRWRTYEPARPGMYVEVDLGKPVPLDQVRVELSPDQDISARLDIEVAPDKWETVSAEPVLSELPPATQARRAATAALKRMGITHLSVSDDEFLAPEMYLNYAGWGVTLVGETTNAKLYRID